MKRFIWGVNIVVAIVTLVMYGLHYFPPSKQSFFLGVTLFLPVVFALNILFLIYWLLKLEYKSILSIMLLLFGGTWIKTFVNFNSSKKYNPSNFKLKFASYNAHYFWWDRPGGKRTFNDEFKKEFFSKEKNIDLLFLQEGDLLVNKDFFSEHFKYSEILNYRNCIYSNYPILKSEQLYWADNAKRCVFTDLLVNKDTIRAYNLHLASFQYPKSSGKLVKKGLVGVYSRLGEVFECHEDQIGMVVEHIKKSPYPVIVCGDFNNLSNSYQCSQLKSLGLKDTFEEAGNGFGATYDFPYFPLRIDYIFVPESAKVISHKVVKTQGWSDHYPIIAEIEL